MSRMAFQYAVLRCVPRPEREEFVNVGVVLHCQRADVLALRWRVDVDRLRAFAPDLDCARLDAAMAFAEAVAAGDPAAGSVAEQPLGQRFGFLKAPRSTVVQPGGVHGGLTDDPLAEVDRLLDRYVG